MITSHRRDTTSFWHQMPTGAGLILRNCPVSVSFVETFEISSVHAQNHSSSPPTKQGGGKIVLCPVVQSIVSLTSSLRGQLVKCFTTFLPNTMIFLLKKWEKLLHCKSFSHFFKKKKKYWRI